VVTSGERAGGAQREVLLRTPPHHLELAALVGDAHITADATHFCLDQGIAVAWLTARRVGVLLSLSAGGKRSPGGGPRRPAPGRPQRARRLT
jgi:hypothetical protein